MNIKELDLPGLELIDPNAVYSGSQTIFVDFDGAEDVSYDNDALNIHLDNLSVARSGLSEAQQSRIIADLNNTFAGAGVTFTASPEECGGQAEHSTIYVGGTGSAFAGYGNFSGLAETLDAGNQIKGDKAFVFSDKLNSPDAITGAVAHEAGHLLGFQHKGTADGNQSISSYALADGEQVTLKVVNNFKNNTQYFSSNYSDDEVWLLFFKTEGSVSYTDTTTMQTTTVTDAAAFQLSTVKNGTFAIANGPGSSTLYAGLGALNPFASVAPGIFDINLPRTLLEFTITGQGDNVDVSYEDTFAFPTTLRVNDSNDVQTHISTFKNNTTAETFISALELAMPDPKPVGPAGENYPSPGDLAGWGPLVPTVASDPAAQRWIGSSKTWQSGQVPGAQEDIYSYVPSFNDYLGYLKTNEQVLFPTENNISGWYIDYSGNQGYSCYLSVTGNDGNYGLQIHDIRYNAGGSAPDWTADPSAGTALNGTITVAVNNANVTYPVSGSGQYTVQGNWTDLTIYSGAALLNGEFASGPIITGTDDLAAAVQGNVLNPTIMASVSASIATGLLGSQSYINKIQDAAQPEATMYWFNELPRDQYSTTLFSAAWPDGQQFYDPYWKALADYTSMQGYLSPFSDRWSNFSPDFSLDTGYSIKWELGTLPLDKMAPEDFNGDGKSDILFTDGTSLGYYADGQPSKWQALGDFASGWQIAGCADFDGNGIEGVLFSNGSQIGYYSEGQQTGWQELGGYSAGWQIAGCADFNGNGKDDILFTDGTSLGCYVDGQPTGWQALGDYAAGWQIAGCADFDGNEKSDVLLTNGSELGYFAGGEQAGWHDVGSYSPGWQIAGCADFDGNGKSDVLFSNSSDNLIGYYADGQPANWINLGSYSAGWQIAGCADFDGNGKGDILFSNSDNLLGYYADGLPANWKSLGSYTAGWQIVMA